jgi:DNA-binding CsgD family transcriptional regulator
MTEQIDPIRLLDKPPARRLWLLLEAMRSLPFDRAVELARTAEAFVAGPTVEAMTPEAMRPTTTTSKDPEQPKEIGHQPSTSANVLADRPTERDSLALSDSDRERLLERLAKGARNVELAAEFGITAKQVQGLRMGCAREIARRRAALADKPSEISGEHDEHPIATTSIDEIVRYVRQQDDVVVPQDDGGYMINGRFRMSAAELIARANRMRSRQRKPSFQMHGAGIQIAAGPARPGHPVFWEKPPAAEHGRNG